jgi:hypothetical protein
MESCDIVLCSEPAFVIDCRPLVAFSRSRSLFHLLEPEIGSSLGICRTFNPSL